MSSKEIKQLLKSIQSKYPCYTLILEPDKSLISGIFYNSQKEIDKIISSIILIPKGKHKLFRFIFTKDLPITLGINKLLNTQSKQSKQRQKFIRDCRASISNQIKDFYETQIKSGKVHKSKEKLVVDHVYPFSKLLEDYCIKSGINLNTIDNKQKEYTNLITNFAEFHRHNAVLQLLPQSINLKKSNKL